MRNMTHGFIQQTLPGPYIRYRVRHHLSNFAHDLGNFSSADELRTFFLGFDVVSFDYFDTLAHRVISLASVQKKTAKFAALLAARQGVSIPWETFYYPRLQYTDMLKRKNRLAGLAQAGNEVDITQFFASVMALYKAQAKAASFARKVVAFETQLELSVLRVDPDFRSLLAHLHACGKRIILISDMYLPQKNMEMLLERQGLKPFFSRVFVSSEAGVTKNSGKLFDYVNRRVRRFGKKRIHVGDNYVSDCIRPREHGWDALHYVSKAHEKQRLKLGLESQLHAHPPAACYDRMQQEAGDPDLVPAVNRLAFSFGAFVRSVLETAAQKNATAIYFCTRDGTIFQQILQDYLAQSRFAPVLDGTTIGTLAINRRASCMLQMPEEVDVDWITETVDYLNNTSPTVGHVLETFNLKTAEETDEEDWDLRLFEDNLDADFRGCAHIDALWRQLRRQRRLIVEYLAQKNLFDPRSRILLVDIGYSGTMLKGISAEFHNRDAHSDMKGAVIGARIDLCLFASNRFFADNRFKLHPLCTMDEGVMMNMSSELTRACSVNYAWLEPMSVDPSLGVLETYRKDAQGVVTPRFKPAEPDADREKARVQLAGAAVRYLLATDDGNFDAAGMDAITRARLATTIGRPQHHEAKALGAFAHHSGAGNSVYQPVNRSVNLLTFKSDMRACLSHDNWLQGSLATSRLRWLIPAVNAIASRAYS